MTGEPEPKLEEEQLCEDLTILSDDSDDSSSDSMVKHLRGRWELASVLNFLNVQTYLASVSSRTYQNIRFRVFSDESLFFLFFINGIYSFV